MPFKKTSVRNKVRAALAADEPPCALCGEPIDYNAHYLEPLSFTVDHIIPSSRGGGDTMDAVQPAHRKCNRDKSNRLNLAVRFETERQW